MKTLKRFLCTLAIVVLVMCFSLMSSMTHVTSPSLTKLPLVRGHTKKDLSIKGNMSVIFPYLRNGTLHAKGPKAEKKQRPMNCIGCFRHDFRYLIQNEVVCSQFPEVPVDLLLLIVTTHDHVKHREGIRETWASLTRNNTANVRHVFLLGMSYDKNLMQAVETESRIHKDIIMEDFHESYGNLTLKTLMGLKWAQNVCPKAKFVMKVDDDMWVNVPELLKVLKTRQAELQSSVGGVCTSTHSPIRDMRSKWYTSVSSYPKQKYPEFCFGTSYVMGMSVAKKVYDVSKDVPFFHLEDVYVGLCLSKLGLSVLALPGFHNVYRDVKPCEMKSDKIITVHGVSPDALQKIMKADC